MHILAQTNFVFGILERDRSCFYKHARMVRQTWIVTYCNYICLRQQSLAPVERPPCTVLVVRKLRDGQSNQKLTEHDVVSERR